MGAMEGGDCGIKEAIIFDTGTHGDPKNKKIFKKNFKKTLKKLLKNFKKKLH